MPTQRHPHALSDACNDVLVAIIDASAPVTVQQLAGVVGVHPNTVRGHLTTLTAASLVSRDHAPIRGRGRPTWLYRPTLAAMQKGPGYAGLATALAAQLELTSRQPRDEAILAGERWGHELAEVAVPVDGINDQVLTLLDELGFSPEVGRDDGRVRLRSCPMIDSARMHPDVVCGVHLGMVRGILKNVGGDPDKAELLTFYEPDVCHLHLGSQPGG